MSSQEAQFNHLRVPFFLADVRNLLKIPLSNSSFVERHYMTYKIH